MALRRQIRWARENSIRSLILLLRGLKLSRQMLAYLMSLLVKVYPGEPKLDCLIAKTHSTSTILNRRSKRVSFLKLKSGRVLLALIANNPVTMHLAAIKTNTVSTAIWRVTIKINALIILTLERDLSNLDWQRSDLRLEESLLNYWSEMSPHLLIQRVSLFPQFLLSL